MTPSVPSRLSASILIAFCLCLPWADALAQPANSDPEWIRRLFPGAKSPAELDPPEIRERNRKEREQREEQMRQEREAREALAAAHRKLQPSDRAIMFLGAEAAYRGADGGYRLSDQSQWKAALGPGSEYGCKLVYTPFAAHVAAFITWKFCHEDRNTTGYIGRVAAARAATSLKPQHITLPTGERGVLTFNKFIENRPFCLGVSVVDDRTGPVRLPDDRICLQ